MTARERLPDRRASETFPVECAGLHYTATSPNCSLMLGACALRSTMRRSRV
jgi:hypothetical protein